jgi:hypothetical protein
VRLEFGAIFDALVRKRLEGDRTFGEKTFGDLDVLEGLHGEDDVRVVRRRQVGAKAVFLVLFLQSGEVVESCEYPHEYEFDTGLFGCPPALLSTYDLVMAASQRRGLHFEKGFVTTGSH